MLENIQYGFLNELYASKLKEASALGRAQWKLHTDLAYNSEIMGMIVANSGFITDFASVPRIPLAYWLTGDTAHASAVIHDYLVRNHFRRGEISWGKAAKVFREAMKHEGVPAWRRQLMYLGVRIKPQSRTA